MFVSEKDNCKDECPMMKPQGKKNNYEEGTEDI